MRTVDLSLHLRVVPHGGPPAALTFFPDCTAAFTSEMMSSTLVVLCTALDIVARREALTVEGVVLKP